MVENEPFTPNQHFYSSLFIRNISIYIPAYNHLPQQNTENKMMTENTQVYVDSRALT